MTYSRTLVVLAKSIKKGDFCIAGKNIETYDWIRPVKDCPFSGEELCNLSNTTDQLKVFDVVEMTFIEKVPEVYQPENELVDMNVKWRYLDDFQIGLNIKYLNISIDTYTGNWMGMGFSGIYSSHIPGINISKNTGSGRSISKIFFNITALEIIKNTAN